MTKKIIEAQFGKQLSALEVIARIGKAFVEGQELGRFDSMAKAAIESIEKEEWFAVLAEISKVLARVNWSYQIEEWTNAECKLTSDSPNPNSHKAEAPMSPQVIEAKNRLYELIQSSPNRSSMLEKKAKERGVEFFPPIYPYLDAFDSIYGNDSPVDYISNSLKTLAPEKCQEDADKACWFDDEKRVSPSHANAEFLVSRLLAPCIARGSTLLVFGERSQKKDFTKFLLELSTRLELLFLRSNADAEQVLGEAGEFDEICASYYCLGKFGEVSSVDKFLSILFRPGLLPIPQGLVIALMQRVFDTWATFDNLRLSGFALASFPFGKTAGSWDELQDCLYQEKWIEDAKSAYPNPGTFPYLPLSMLESGLAPFWSYSSSIETPWDEMDWMIHSRSRRLHALSGSLLQDRLPFDYRNVDEDLCHVEFIDSHADADNRQLTVAMYLIAIKSQAFRLEFGGEHELELDKALSSQKLYSMCHDSAADDSLPKIGNALLAFYLTRTALIANSLDIELTYDWVMLNSQLRKAKDLPGWNWIMLALETNIKICELNKWTVPALYLENARSTESAVTPMLNYAGLVRSSDEVAQMGNEIQCRMHKTYGNKWSLLSDRVRRMICHADARFERDAADFGRYDADYAAFVMDYVKPFEVELESRLKSIYVQDVTRKFLALKHPKWDAGRKPTFSSYLFLLKNTGQMPEDLLSAVEKCVGKSHANKSLLQKLEKLVNMRNKAAHTGHVTENELTAVRALIFREGLLEDYLDELSALD